MGYQNYLPVSIVNPLMDLGGVIILANKKRIFKLSKLINDSNVVTVIRLSTYFNSLSGNAPECALRLARGVAAMRPNAPETTRHFHWPIAKNMHFALLSNGHL
jgi:hypothetical protein